MSRIMLRFDKQRQADEAANIRRNAAHAEFRAEREPEEGKQPYRFPVDHRRLRGIPAIGYGVTGAIPGTRPDHAIDEKES